MSASMKRPFPLLDGPALLFEFPRFGLIESREHDSGELPVAANFFLGSAPPENTR